MTPDTRQSRHAAVCACGHVHAADEQHEDAGCRTCDCMEWRAPTVVCSCGWGGSDWAEAKEHIASGMKANETAETPVVHEVVRYYEVFRV